MRLLAPPPAPVATGDERHVVRGSMWLMVGFVAQAATGILFWLLAARRFESAEVGRAAAVFASLQFVNYLTAMGLQEMLARFHPERTDRRDPLLAWSVLVTASTSVVGTALYLSLVPSVRGVLAHAGTVPGSLLFLVLGIGSAVAVLTDVRFMEARRWRWVFWRLVLVGAARIPALWLPAPGSDDLWLFVVMSAPIAVSGAVGLVGLRQCARLRLTLSPAPQRGREAVRYAAVNYVAHLALLAPQFALPVIVLVHVTATANANFFLAWAMAAVVAILPVTIGRVLVVEGSRPGSDLVVQVRRALRLAVAVTAVAAMGAWIGSDLVTEIMGRDYDDAGRILPSLVAGGVPWAVTSIALAHSRVRHDPVGTVVMTVTLAVAILGLALAWVPADGIDGAAQAWLVGNVVAAVVAIPLWKRALHLPLASERSVATPVTRPLVGTP
ncbi:MAG TPA: hypothetical protein VM618_08535 [Acidimicrobiia bacterium]|nr:hypothetical protein [Acidimicrobiia bacterium]